MGRSSIGPPWAGPRNPAPFHHVRKVLRPAERRLWHNQLPMRRHSSRAVHGPGRADDGPIDDRHTQSLLLCSTHELHVHILNGETYGVWTHAAVRLRLPGPGAPVGGALAPRARSRRALQRPALLDRLRQAARAGPLRRHLFRRQRRLPRHLPGKRRRRAGRCRTDSGQRPLPGGLGDGQRHRKPRLRADRIDLLRAPLRAGPPVQHPRSPHRRPSGLEPGDLLRRQRRPQPRHRAADPARRAIRHGRGAPRGRATSCGRRPGRTTPSCAIGTAVSTSTPAACTTSTITASTSTCPVSRCASPPRSAPR